MKKKIKNVFVLAIGVGIIFYLLCQVNLGDLIAIIRNSDPLLLGVGLIISVIPPFLNSIKWKLLLNNKDIELSLLNLFINQMIGLFISSFFPSKYGGDVYRIYIVARYSGQTYDSAASVLLQRLSGLFVLVSICFLGAGFCLLILKTYEIAAATMIACLIIILGVASIFSRRAFAGMNKLLEVLRLGFLQKHAIKFHTAIMDYRHEKRLIHVIIWLSVLFYLAAFITIYIICLAIGVSVPFMYIVFVVPVIYLLETLPISINGLGIREGAFVFFFMKIGLLFEQAFAISIMVLCFRLVKSLLGGILFLLRYGDVKWFRQAESKTMSPS